MRRVRHPWLGAFVVIIGAWLVVPTLVVIPLSFTALPSFAFPPHKWGIDFYSNFFSGSGWLLSMEHSLGIGALVCCVSLTVGTAAALCVSRLPRIARTVVSGVMVLPMIIPSIILAIGLYSVLARMRLIGSTVGFVVSHSVLALPFVFITVMASLDGFDRNLERAAASLGAGRLRVLAKVVFPLILPGLLAAAIFAFETSFDEVIVALFINSPSLVTLPVQMYTSIVRGSDPTMAVASSLIVGVVIVVIVAVSTTSSLRRRRGRS